MRMKSAGVIIFRKIDNKIKYLLLKHVKTESHWGFPKGRIEEGEKIEEAALRELQEETGLKMKKFIDGFKSEENYSFINPEGMKIEKTVTYFLAEIKKEKTELSKEHSEIAWYSFDESLKKLDKQNLKDLLKKANDYIINFKG